MRPVWLACAVLLPAPAAAAPDPRTADRAAIVAGEEAWGQAFVVRNVPTIDRLLDEGFLGTDIDGSRYTKAQMRRWVEVDPSNTATRTTVTAIAFWDDTAVVQGEDDLIGPPPERKPGVRVWTDTWIKRDGRWRIVGSHDMRPSPKS